ncbi:MAG: flavodoxin family protein [Gimesia sp.]
MTRIAIIYYSQSGNTARMAEAVFQGANSMEDVQVSLITIDGKDIIEGRWKNEEIMARLDASDAIIFGTPTYMGSVSAQLKALFDSAVGRYLEGAWKNKVASGFTVSAAPSGDKMNALLTQVIFSMQMGMVWVGLGNNGMNADGINRLGINLGATGQAHEEPLSADDLKTGEFLGKRVADFTVKLTS